MGFYHQIRNTYGEHAANVLKQWANISNSLVSYSSRINFLTSCKRHKVTPRHISQNIRVDNIELLTATGRQEDIINKRLRLKLLKLEISYCYKYVHQLKNRYTRLNNIAYEFLPHNIVKNYESRLKHSFNRKLSRVGRDMTRKLNNLIKIEKDHLVTEEKWIKNLTDKTIPADVRKILALGPKFAYPPERRDISVKHLLADVEQAISWAPKEAQNILRAKTTNVITNHLNKNRDVSSTTTQMLKQTRKFLSENPDIVVTDSDKGGVTVLISRDEYDRKMTELLEDRSVYKVLARDPTQSFQNKNNEVVKLLKDKEYIDPVTARKLTTYKAVAPRLYGLPKVHKQDIPMRPIVSTINSPTSGISKWMADILKAAFADYNEFSIKNSFDFAEKMNNFKLPDEHAVISLDVVSLFTNISLELTLHIIQEEWTRVEQVTTVPIEWFVSIMEFIFSANYFVYNDTYYAMVFGCPMGSCLSPIIANIVMTSLIKSSIGRLSFTPPFFFQYVDDLLTAIPTGRLNEVLSIFNQYDEHLKFTAEEENEMSLPFLDTRIIRQEDNTIKLDWYQKETSSGRYIHYRSYHDIKMKTNVILALKDRIKRITHTSLYNSAINRLKRVLLKNGYPNEFLNKLLFNTKERERKEIIEGVHETSQRQEAPQQHTKNDNGPPAEEEITQFASLPYIEDLTSGIMSVMKQVGDMKIARYNLVTNRRVYSKLKDRVPMMSKSDIIYEIPCKTCNRKYIGQCSTKLRNRIAIHRSDIRLRPERCTLSKHAVENKHEIDFNRVKIKAQEPVYSKRIFLEMCHINECSDPINSRTDIENLSIIYSSLLLQDTSKNSHVG